jgi:uncharacterized protein (DUF2225 family)
LTKENTFHVTCHVICVTSFSKQISYVTSNVSYFFTKKISCHMCDIIFKTDLMFARFVLTKENTFHVTCHVICVTSFSKQISCVTSNVSYVLTKKISCHMCDIIFKKDIMFAGLVLTTKPISCVTSSVGYVT